MQRIEHDAYDDASEGSGDEYGGDLGEYEVDELLTDRCNNSRYFSLRTPCGRVFVVHSVWGPEGHPAVAPSAGRKKETDAIGTLDGYSFISRRPSD